MNLLGRISPTEVDKWQWNLAHDLIDELTEILLWTDRHKFICPCSRKMPREVRLRDLWCGWCANSADGISAAPDAEFIFRICLSFQHYSTLRFCGVVSGGRPDWRMSWLTDWLTDMLMGTWLYLLRWDININTNPFRSVQSIYHIPMMWRTEDDMSSSYRVMMRCESPQPGHSTTSPSATHSLGMFAIIILFAAK